MLVIPTSNHNELTFLTKCISKLKRSVISNYTGELLCTAGGRANWNNSCGKSLYKLLEHVFLPWLGHSIPAEIIYRSGHVCKKISTTSLSMLTKNKDKTKHNWKNNPKTMLSKRRLYKRAFTHLSFMYSWKWTMQLYMDTFKTTLSETHNPDKTPHRIPFFIRLLNKTNNTLFRESTYLDAWMWDLFWCKTQGEVDVGGGVNIKNSFKDTLMFYSLVAQQ